MKPIEEALRLALTGVMATNAEARACCARLAGKAIAVECWDQRVLIRFQHEDGESRVDVDASENPAAQADVVVRGSPAAVIGALTGVSGNTAAVFGDVDLFVDFRRSFRPHAAFAGAFDQLAEDAGDAVFIAARAARSALEGLLGALAERFGPHAAPAAPANPDAEAGAEIAELTARVRELEERIRALQSRDEDAAPEQSSEPSERSQ